MKLRAIPILVAAMALSAGGAHADGVKAAVFDCQLANLGQLPPTAADKARLPHVSDLLRQKLAESGKLNHWIEELKKGKVGTSRCRSLPLRQRAILEKDISAATPGE